MNAEVNIIEVIAIDFLYNLFINSLIVLYWIETTVAFFKASINHFVEIKCLKYMMSKIYYSIMGLWTALLAIAVHNLLQIIKIQSMSMYVYVNFIQVYFLFSEYYT